MCNEPLILRLRTKLRKVLPAEAFLQRDRGDALFVTDALRRGFVPEELPDCIFKQKGGLLYILPSAEMLADFESAFAQPEGDLSRSLYRFCGRSANEENLCLFAKGLKLQEKPDLRQLSLFEREIRQRAAYTLRTKGTGGGLYALALLLEQIERNEV